MRRPLLRAFRVVCGIIAVAATTLWVWSHWRLDAFAWEIATSPQDVANARAAAVAGQGNLFSFVEMEITQGSTRRLMRLQAGGGRLTFGNPMPFI